MPFANMRITAGDETCKAIVDYFVHKFFYFIFIYLINLKYST